MEYKSFRIEDLAGNAVTGATVSVYLTGTTTHATGLQDFDGGPVYSPFTSSVPTGKVGFRAPNGTYDIVMVRGTFTDVLYGTEFFDIEDANIDRSGRYDSVQALLDSTDPARGEGKVWQGGARLFTEAAVGAFDYHEITAGGVGLYEAGDRFTTQARAESGDTLGSDVIYIGNFAFKQDVAGTDLTTGDGLTWRLLLGAAPGVDLRRSLQIEVPFHSETLLTMEDDDGATTPGTNPLIYPQAFAVDSANNRVFIWCVRTDGGYVVARNLTTGSHISTFFVAAGVGRECLVYRNEGASQYLYGLTTTGMFRVDVTTMPTEGSTVTPSGGDLFTPDVTPNTQMCRAGGFWVYASASVQNPGGVAVKHRFIVADDSFAKVGEIEFPIGAVGSFGDYQNNLVKTQGIAFHNGLFHFGCGGDYRPSAGGSKADDSSPYNAQGLITCSANGDVVSTALAKASHAMSRFGDMVGRTLGVIENEGVCSDGGALYGLWQTLTPAEWESSLGTTRGIVITKESSTAGDAVDFASGPFPNYRPFDQRKTQGVRVDGVQLTNPVSGDDLDTFDDIIDMMIGLGLTEYAFYGTNQTISDINSDPVSVSGCLVRFTLASDAGCLVEIEGARARSKYWVYDIGTTRAQFDPVSVLDSSGDLRLGGAVEAAPATGVFGILAGVDGELSVSRNNETPVTIRRGGNDGYALVSYGKDGNVSGGILVRNGRADLRFTSSHWISGGAGSPEGVVSGPVGCVWMRTDGGAGTTMYVKESGTGTTGWVAK